MYRVRFNLGRGVNYKKWKILNIKSKEILIIDPFEKQLELVDCKLINNKKAANNIFNGHNKYVCSWIECKNVNIIELETSIFKEVSYNPKIAPNWVNSVGEDIDFKTFSKLVTKNNKVYIADEQ
jgi:hypothetical protein